MAMPAPTLVARPDAVRRARLLNRLTIGYNALEAVVALGAGFVAGSISLVGFGFDSVIETSAALILAWRLHQERRGGCMQESDRLAARAIAASLMALSVVVAVEAARNLAQEARPDASVVGVGVALASVIIMPFLARAKARLAPALGSAAVAADATQTRLCGWLSAVLLVGVGANAAFGWWWADPVSAFGIAGLAGWEGVRAFRAGSLADTCCV